LSPITAKPATDLQFKTSHPRRRWIEERTFGWLMKQRRLVCDYEVTGDSAEAWVYIAMRRIMLCRLA